MLFIVVLPLASPLSLQKLPLVQTVEVGTECDAAVRGNLKKYAFQTLRVCVERILSWEARPHHLSSSTVSELRERMAMPGVPLSLTNPQSSSRRFATT